MKKYFNIHKIILTINFNSKEENNKSEIIRIAKQINISSYENY